MGIGVATKTKVSAAEPASSTTATPAVNKPSAQDLLAIKLRRKEAEPKLETRTEKVKTTLPSGPTRCSTTDEELEALFSAIDQEINDDPDAAIDLLDILEDDPEASEEMDEEMKEMLDMIERAKGEIDTTNEEELVKMMDRLDDDEYFEKLRSDVIAAEEMKAKEVAEKSRKEAMEAQEAAERSKREAELLARKQLEEKAKKEAEEKAKKESEAAVVKTEESKMDEDAISNKRRAEETLPEKEPSEKKPKTIKKKKAIAAGGVNMFGGKDLFGGKNPFAGRKQEISSDEEEEVEDLETDSPGPAQNGSGSSSSAPPPPPLPSINIAVQADSEEKPVSFDDLPSDSHVISSTTKSRVSTLPSRRRPTARGAGKGAETGASNGHNGDLPGGDLEARMEDRVGKCETNIGPEERTNRLTERLAPPINDSEEYDGDESELSCSVIKRGRRSTKKKQPPKGGVSLFGGADLFKGKNPFAHRRDDSEERDVERSRSIEPADDKTNDEITVVESQSAMNKEWHNKRRRKDEKQLKKKS